MIVERSGVLCGVSKGALDAFVRVARTPDRLVVAVAEGSSCGWTSGVEAISAPVLDGIELALALDPAASVASLFGAAHAAFLRAAEPYPDDEDVGGPSAWLTIAELARRRMRVGQIGRIEAILVCNGVAASPGRELEVLPIVRLERAPRAPSLMELRLLDDDLIVVSTQWVGLGVVLADVIQELARAYREPRRLVEAAIARFRNDVRREQEIGRLIGEPGLALAAVRV